MVQPFVAQNNKQYGQSSIYPNNQKYGLVSPKSEKIPSPMLIPVHPLHTQNCSPLHPPKINITLTICVSAKHILKI